jgi:hypothetical protein
MNPDAVGLDPAAAVAGERRPPSRGGRADAAPPRDELDFSVVEEGRDDVDHVSPDDPEVLGRAPPRLGDIVGGHVLQIPGDRVEPQPPRRVHVGQTNLPRSREPAAGRRLRRHLLRRHGLGRPAHAAIITRAARASPSFGPAASPGRRIVSVGLVPTVINVCSELRRYELHAAPRMREEVRA